MAETNTEKKDDSAVRATQLTEFEDGALKTGATPPSSITWFSGGSHETAAAVLQHRLERVLDKNPWLAGRIVQRDDGHSYLEYNTAVDKTPSGMFRHITNKDPVVQISKTTPFSELGGLLADAGLMLKRDHNPNIPLFLLSVVASSSSSSSSNNSEFAVIVSLSHVVGDGHTFYAIYNMLMSGTKIEALQADRVDVAMERIDQVMGKKEARLLSSIGFIWTVIRGLFSANLLSRFSRQYQVQTQYWLVDGDKMKLLKQKEVQALGSMDTSTPSFVSTNDVLTSWYLRNSGCRHGMMAINLRGRIKGYTKELAGNYENLVYYRIPDDCSSSMQIRQSLAPLKRTVTSDSPPTTMEVARGDFAIISSWATFARDDKVNLGEDNRNCREEAHMPIFDYRGAPSSIAMAFAFRYAPGQLGVLVLGTPSQLEGLQKPEFASVDQTIDYHF